MMRPDRASRVIGVLLVVAVLTVAWTQSRAASNYSRDAQEARVERDVLAGDVDALRQQVEVLCGDDCEPIAPPSDETAGDTDETGVVGPPGPPGPTPSASQVRRAVERYCQVNGCVGPRGPAPTETQVAAAVAAYCDDRGECRGPEGAAGAEGADGSDGEDGRSITGPQGPGPTAAQIATAVESYCATRDGCRGPAGADGADGEDSTVPGPQGPAGPAGQDGSPGPACPGGAEPVEWVVDQQRSTVVGLDPGTYVICRGAS